MDIVTILGGSAGVGGLAVSVYGVWNNRKTARESAAVQHVEMALDAQQDQITRQAEKLLAQDVKIERQDAQIETLTRQVQELRDRLIRCDEERRSLARQLAIARRGLL